MTYRKTNSAFYTPTEVGAGSANIAAVTFYDAMWTRVGDIVTVSGRVEVDTTAAGSTQLAIALPIASNIAGLEGVSGTACSNTVAAQSAAMRGDATNNCAVMDWIAVSTASENMYYIYQYMII